MKKKNHRKPNPTKEKKEGAGGKLLDDEMILKK